ncbi:transmembrane and coiled-coil domain-containing protein 6 [Gastrophryne carolinensis]
MWQRKKLGKRLALGLEELRAQRRERETALRKARREKQLISKRLLRDLPEDEASLDDDVPQFSLSEHQVLQLIHDIRHGSADKLRPLTDLRRGLRSKDVQLLFIRVEGSMRVLIGLFTCQFAKVQMEAARCLHELSHSDDPSVSKACLPATSYLLTYVSGSSAELAELCLYTLGNLIVESEEARHQLLQQGIILALASCMQSPHVTVLEATGYALAQLLQAKEAPQKIIPILLEAGLTQDIIRLLLSDLEDGFGMMIEFAWCLHYIVSSHMNNTLLISQDIVPNLVLLLAKLAGFLTCTAFPQAELVVCPLIRCMGNLLAEVDAAGNKNHIQDGRLLVALFAFIYHFQKDHVFVVREGLWTLNNMTVKDPMICSAIVHLKLVPAILQLLGHSKDVILLALTVLCNIADLGPAYCQSLKEHGVLSRVTSLLRTSDVPVTLRCLDLLITFLHYWPEVVKDSEMLSGLQSLGSCKDHPELSQRLQEIQAYCKLPIPESSAGMQPVE